MSAEAFTPRASAVGPPEAARLVALLAIRVIHWRPVWMMDAVLCRQGRRLVPSVPEHEAARHMVGDGAGLHVSTSVAGRSEQEQRGYRDRPWGPQSSFGFGERYVGHPPVSAAGAHGPGDPHPSDVVMAGVAALRAGTGVVGVPAVRTYPASGRPKRVSLAHRITVGAADHGPPSSPVRRLPRVGSRTAGNEPDSFSTRRFSPSSRTPLPVSVPANPRRRSLLPQGRHACMVPFDD
jgi:hypothetical protein